MLLWGGLHIHWLDLFLILAYLAAMLGVGFYLGRRIKSAKDYFLAGRSLPWWIIGLSIIGSNIGSNDYVGASGGAYSIGVAQANFEWIGAIPAMILASFLFIPFYWRAGVYSVPEYMGLRYNQTVRALAAIILSLFNVFIVGVYLWAAATMLEVYIGLPMFWGVGLIALVVGVYTISGGLAAVAISDTMQMTIMFAGSAALAYLAIDRIGGLEVFWERLRTEHPEKLNAFLPADHPAFPWPGVLLGLALVMSPSYWCTNQVILQRTFGARSQWDGQAAMVFAAMGKSLVPFLIVLPGLLALLLAGPELEKQDQALPWLIREILPPGLSGLLFVAFIAALQSSVDSTLNSTAVMLTRDVWGVFRRRGRMTQELHAEAEAAEEEAAEARDLGRGKWITFAALLIGAVFAWNLELVQDRFSGIYELVQVGLAYFQGPFFALMLLGILSARITGAAGLGALIGGVLLAALLDGAFAWLFGPLGVQSGPLVEGLNMLYIAFWSFLGSILLLIALSFATRPHDRARLQNLTIHTMPRRSPSNRVPSAPDASEREAGDV